MPDLPPLPRRFLTLGVCCLLHVFGCVVQTQEETVATQPETVIAAYLPEYRIKSFDEGHLKHLTNLILFSIEVDSQGGLVLDRWKPDLLDIMDRLGREAPCRVLISVGGWGRSEGFREVAASPEMRTRFAKELVEFCQVHGLDGVDLDWEHPANEEERKQFVVLIADLGQTLHQHSLLLTTALAPWKPVELAVARSVDRIHLMSYDDEGRHSTLEQAAANIEKWRAAGIPAEKLCLGLPCYGKSITNRSQPARTYARLVAELPGLTGDEVEGVYFNGPDTIEAKLDLAKTQGLSGVFFWELAQDLPADAERSLIRTAARRAETRR